MRWGRSWVKGRGGCPACAHFVAFDLLRLAAADTTQWPYRRHRGALEGLFAESRLRAPWGAVSLHNRPGDRARVAGRLDSRGPRGRVFKRIDGALVRPLAAIYS
ncbi:hypothetical protein GCM10010254_75500 [Streptomyces chromofuscus]|nr:hypothetical protein GCM10010254_75500 [Streptomyces chromofuscus]